MPASQVSRLRDLPIFLCYLVTLIHTYRLAQVRPKATQQLPREGGRASRTAAAAAAAVAPASSPSPPSPPSLFEATDHRQAGGPPMSRRGGDLSALSSVRSAWAASIKGLRRVVHVYRCESDAWYTGTFAKHACLNYE